MFRQTMFVLVAGLAIAAGCSSREETLTPEQARAKGNELLKKFSAHVAATKSFSYTADEMRERVKRDGTKVEDRFTRKVVVRRPDAVMFVETGEGHDAAAWYDGSSLTFVSNKNKVWAKGPMPATLDEAMDFVSAEYAVQIPTADLLYSSPFDALVGPTTTGGWVKVDTVDVRSCDLLAYQETDVDWQLWLTRDERALPCKMEITYKTEPSKPRAVVVFHDWNPSPVLTESTFVAAIPDGFTRIKIMRHATEVVEPTAEGSTPPTPAPAAPAKPE